VSRLGDLARRYGLDVLIVLMALAAALELALRQDAEDAPGTTLWFCIPVTVLAVLTLLLRRPFPFGAPAAFWLLGAALSFVDGELIPFPAGIYLAGMAAAFLLGNLRDARLARIGLLVVVGSAAIIIYNLPDRSAGEFVFIPLLFAIAWLAGYALRTRAEQTEAAEARAAQAERERELAARIAVAEERARIARELHDVVAHAVSVMVLHAGAVRHNLPDDRAADREALRDVERAGRSALAEMRRLLGAMRDGSDEVELTPHPGLGNLGPLLDEVRGAGLAVELHVEGEPFTLPAAIDLSAYRIVQEGLTNALKHARASRADVLVRYAADELRIDVRDDGHGAAASSDGLGHGLVGIRERVKLFGGDMTAGAANGEGFLLSTRLPLTGVER
jgi:signal transduction histidine kinase